MENNNEKKIFFTGLIAGLVVTLLGVAICFGTVTAVRNYRDRDKIKIVFDEAKAVNTKAVKKLQLLEDVIDKMYYLEDYTPEQLEEGMFKGLMSSLGDPYTEYYNQEEIKDLMSDLSGVFYGIGAHVSIDPDTQLPKIAGTIAGAPAERAGIRPNDLIFQIDDLSTFGMTLTEAVSHIRGELGTKVTLTVIREGAEDYLEFEITREEVSFDTVTGKIIEDGIAYIQIAEFDEITSEQFDEQLRLLKATGMNGLIIDVRGNPGGSLDTVADIARNLLPEGLIVYTEDKYGKRTDFTCGGLNELKVPCVMLVDMNSASASEILAGAMQDHGKAILVGTTTYGKGIVQQIQNLSDGTAVKVTISRYFTPNGRNIHGTGIEPDVVCEFDGERYYDSDGEDDNQLEKAIEVLKSEMKKAK